MQRFTALITALSIAGLVGLGGWWTVYIREQLGETERLEETNAELEDQVKEKDGRIAELDEEVALISTELDDARAQIQDLETSMWLLKLSHRVARVTVLNQVGQGSETETLIEFVELGTEGQPVGTPREILVKGKQLFIEGRVIKFEDEFVEAGDLLRGSSVAVLQRVFSENQAPSEGTELDAPTMHPLPGHDDDVGHPFYEDLWENFWEYANDPDAAAEKGVRAMHGSAPFIELRPGQSYRVELRASDGLSITAEE